MEEENKQTEGNASEENVSAENSQIFQYLEEDFYILSCSIPTTSKIGWMTD